MTVLSQVEQDMQRRSSGHPRPWPCKGSQLSPSGSGTNVNSRSWANRSLHTIMPMVRSAQQRQLLPT
jgi:hypothetical protein